MKLIRLFTISMLLFSIHHISAMDGANTNGAMRALQTGDHDAFANAILGNNNANIPQPGPSNDPNMSKDRKKFLEQKRVVQDNLTQAEQTLSRGYRENIAHPLTDEERSELEVTTKTLEATLENLDFLEHLQTEQLMQVESLQVPMPSVSIGGLANQNPAVQQRLYANNSQMTQLAQVRGNNRQPFVLRDTEIEYPSDSSVLSSHLTRLPPLTNLPQRNFGTGSYSENGLTVSIDSMRPTEEAVTDYSKNKPTNQRLSLKYLLIIPAIVIPSTIAYFVGKSQRTKRSSTLRS